MLTYKLKIKQPGQWFYRTYTLTGVNYTPDMDVMVLIKADGTFEEVPEYSKCRVKYGQDMVKARQAQQGASNADVPRVQE